MAVNAIQAIHPARPVAVDHWLQLASQLACAGTGRVLVTPGGTPIAQCTVADAMQAEGWWQPRGGYLQFASDVTQAAWNAAVRRMGQQLPCNAFPVYDPLATLVAVGRLRTLDEDAQAPHVLLLRPLRATTDDACIDALRRMFDLTVAEAALAIALHRHDDLAIAAQALGITLGSARTRLKHVLEKTELRRQVELLRLIDAVAGVV